MHVIVTVSINNLRSNEFLLAVLTIKFQGRHDAALFLNLCSFYICCYNGLKAA